MKISKFEVKNLLGLKEFAWSGKDIELRGKKGQGKSSVLDSLKLALTNHSTRPVIIHEGAREGEVFIETTGGLRVNRKRRMDKADYNSIKNGDEKDQKTESFLREFFTELQLNPIEFSNMTEKDQNRIILDLIHFKWDLEWIKAQFGEIPPEVDYSQNILNVLHDIQSEQGYYFQKRQDVNRENKSKTAIVDEIGKMLPESYSAEKWEKFSLSGIYNRIEAIRHKNNQVEEAKRAVESREDKIRGFDADYKIAQNAIEKETSNTRNRLEKTIADLENQIKAAKKDLETLEEKKQDKLALAKKTYEAAIAKFEGILKQYESAAKEEVADFTELQEEADHAEKMKEFIREYRKMEQYQADIEALIEQEANLTAKIEKARSLPGEILAQAEIPIVGLSIVNGVPLINGRPIANLSDGEKLDLCIQVATEREGSIQLLLLDGMEKLPKEDQNRIYATLKKKGVQFIATCVTEDDKLTVVEL